MAAELVETARLWGRTNGRIEPEWAEKLAGPLAKHHYSEPHWSTKREAVLAKERVTLFGVPLVADRTVNFGRIDPVAARELFLAKHGQEALGPQRRPAGLWGAAVRGLAAVLTETRLERIAGGVDRILPRIPAGLGRKLVALCVEAAAHAGERHPDRARGTF